MHNGAYRTLEEAVMQKVKASSLARSDDLRSADPQLSVMRIDEEDVAPLVAFLKSLQDYSAEEFATFENSARRVGD